MNLMYIRGISRYDTMYFSSISEQENYFASHRVASIDCYYPPYYTNTIKISTSEYNPNNQANYVSLNSNNKNYYYFIDAISYISEDIYEIHITMDTIQTFMFDINWNESLVNRMSIKRWNDDGAINRDYIRENLSEGDMELKAYNLYSDLEYIIIECERHYDSASWSPHDTIIKINNTVVSNGHYYYVIPYIRNSERYQNITFINGDVWSKSFNAKYYEERLASLLRNLVQNPYTINIFNVKSPCASKFFNFDIRDDQDYILSFNDSDMNQFYGGYEVVEEAFLSFNYNAEDVYPALLLSEINIKWDYEISYNFQFSKNSNLNTNFSINYIPQLLDENYIDFKYGERNCFASYPLHKMEKPYFKCQSSYDIISGFRNHRIIEDYRQPLVSDPYMTTVVNNTIESYDLYTDAWETYQAEHKGDLTIGRLSSVPMTTAKTAVNIGEGMAYGLINPTIGYAKMGSAAASGILDIINQNIQYQVTKSNMEHTPDTLRSGNTFSNDILSLYTNTCVCKMECEDIITVGKKLEYGGYKVNKYFSGNNLFNALNIRQYYNVIQCKYLSITLSVMSSTEMVENLKSRFLDGLRMWNSSRNTYIGEALNNNYDNVEK